MKFLENQFFPSVVALFDGCGLVSIGFTLPLFRQVPDGMLWFSVGGQGASQIRNTFKGPKQMQTSGPCLCHSAQKKVLILPTLLGAR